MQLVPQAGPVPCGQASPAGQAGARLLWQVLPLDPGVQPNGIPHDVWRSGAGRQNTPLHTCPSPRSVRCASRSRRSGSRRLLERDGGAAVVPGPRRQDFDGLVEGPPEVGEAVLDPPWRFGVACDQTVDLQSTQRLRRKPRGLIAASIQYGHAYTQMLQG
ncbi:hypothetical protein ACE1SV_00530 [Streptomyces sennicomposti]